ncbi:MAG: hypothetical protein OMM_09857 [Candidatus Magnetoglobus multicellularis str. Araruama]|uniref:Uncharacterized protein n=1 Tax=Candidatus Magnetoglobus multicellularis str. Araruama TaxID=890399 RepID=A0A1V1P2L9_9BACT|nr:MAG: hypothetical protein OMM_09857 [Candidatus Magnetoglobus multicellularis str. Araruama]
MAPRNYGWSINLDIKWTPHQKGGSFRRWYGNNEYVVNWQNDGQEMREFGTENGGKPKSRVQNREFYFQPGVTRSDLTVAKFAGRVFKNGFTFDITGPSLFPIYFENQIKIAAYVNCIIFQQFLNVSLAGMHYSNGVIAKMPYLEPENKALIIK